MKTGQLEFSAVLKILRAVRVQLIYLFCFYIVTVIPYDFTVLQLLIEYWMIIAGMMGLFCPCFLFGQNVENLRDDITRNDACFCHALCVEGGMVIAAATLFWHGIDPKTSFLIGETLVFAWWLCGIYNGLFRQSLQKKYHLKV